MRSFSHDTNLYEALKRRYSTAALITWYCLFLFSLSASAQQITFRDITAQAGIHFIHNNGAFAKKYLPETMGPGCPFLDDDNAAWPDIVLINGEDWPAQRGPATTPKPYPKK